jgi:hypothetical protein
MPSPFPGMDPYLENPGLWPDVHHEVISVARQFLAEQLRPKYLVRVEQRVYVSDEDDPGRRVIAPDLRVAERPGWESHPLTPSQGGTATVEVAEPITITLIEDEIHEPRLEVIDRERREVVTVIEVVSPTNKVGGSRGRGSYLKKRAEVFDSPSHWVEIDLLRGGEPLLPVSQFRPCEYRVCLSRANKRPDATVWPIRLTQRLPVIAIPLRGDDPDARLDLQAVLSTVYDRAAYDLELDYRAEPVPPLPPELGAWANEWLKVKGVR